MESALIKKARLNSRHSRACESRVARSVRELVNGNYLIFRTDSPRSPVSASPFPPLPRRDDRAAILINSINCDKAALFRQPFNCELFTFSAIRAKFRTRVREGDCHPRVEWRTRRVDSEAANRSDARAIAVSYFRY